MEFNKGIKEHREGNYTPDGVKVNSLAFVLEGNTFPQSYKNYSFEEILPHYINYIREQERYRVEKLHAQIIKQNEGLVNHENYVCIPAYIDEDIKKLIDVVKGQVTEEDMVMIYLNGYIKKGIHKRKLSKKLYSFREYAKEQGINTTIIGHLYDERVSIGSIRADMMDALILSLAETVEDPKIIGLDADTRHIDEGYIQRSKKMLDDNKDLSYVVGQRRTANQNKKDLLRLSEKMFIARRKQVPIAQKPGITYGPVTSYRLSEYCKIKGYYRLAEKGEDIDLGNIIRWYHGNDGQKSKKVGNSIGGKVYVDPRRAITSLMEGVYLECMRDGQFYIFEKSQKIESEKVYNLYERDNIINNLFTNQDLSAAKIGFVEKFLNNHNKGSWVGKKKRQNYMNMLKRFWNIKLNTCCNYELTSEDKKFKLISKHGKINEQHS